MSYPEPNAYANEMDSKICFHCTPYDFTSELSILGEPMSEIEQAFVLENCRAIDRGTWINEFQQIKSGEPELSTENRETVLATSDTAPSVIANDRVARDLSKLEECHICGMFFRNITENRLLLLR